MMTGAGAATRRGLLVVLSGPSGVGKDSVLRRAMELDPALRYSVSYTTRSPRPGEEDGRSYSFVDPKTFRTMADRGELLEWAEVHGNLYGTSLARVTEAISRGEAIALKIDVQGAALVRDRLDDDRLRQGLGDAGLDVGLNAGLNAGLFVFLLPPTLDELRQRLLGRDTEAAGDADLRLARATAELAEAGRYDHRIVNDDVDRAARELLEVIRSRREGGPERAGG